MKKAQVSYWQPRRKRTRRDAARKHDEQGGDGEDDEQGSLGGIGGGCNCMKNVCGIGDGLDVVMFCVAGG